METRKNRTLHFRASPMEEECLKSLCHREGLNISEALRLALREATKSRGLWPKVVIDNPKEESPA